MKQVKTQSELESANNETNIELDGKIECREIKVSGLINDKITSKQLDMCETQTLSNGTYTNLPKINQANLNVIKVK